MAEDLKLSEKMIEDQLFNYWKEILGHENFSKTDSFFEVGGNSLLAMQFIQMVKNNVDVKLPIKVLFKQSSIKDLANLIKKLSDISN